MILIVAFLMLEEKKISHNKDFAGLARMAHRFSSLASAFGRPRLTYLGKTLFTNQVFGEIKI